MDKKVDMKKKGIDFEVEDNRSEIKDKVKENARKKVGVVKKTKKTDVNLEQTMALDTVKILREGKAKKPTEEEKRSEIKGKVVRKSKKTDVNLEQTMALETIKILREGKVKKPTEEEKRSEIATKVGSKKVKSTSSVTDVPKKIKSRKIRYDDITMEENQEDKAQENVETVSLAMIAMFVLFCIVVTVVIGYMLYKIALTNSDVMAVATILKKFGL